LRVEFGIHSRKIPFGVISFTCLGRTVLRLQNGRAGVAQVIKETPKCVAASAKSAADLHRFQDDAPKTAV
jgi:hypothetical protein